MKLRHKCRYIVIAIVLYLVGGAILPFTVQPEVREQTKEELDVSEFYSEEASEERAAVLSENGEALEERIRLIAGATQEIILSSFEFRSDTSGKMVLAALMDAAQRGVRVRVLADGVPYLVSMMGNPYFQALADMEHAEIKIYNPVRIWKPWTVMGSLHDKYLIADDYAYILGGRNTYDYFLGDWPGHKNYDWDVLVYGEEETPSLDQVRDYFESIWEMPECRIMGAGLLESRREDAKEELRELYCRMKEEHEDWFVQEDYRERTVPVNQIRLVSNPTHIFAKEPVVYYTITELMKQAKETVIFHTPYIICNEWMLGRLEEICSRVDQVWMMTNSVANNGNPFGAMDYQKYKGAILETGVNILEYDGGVSYHGKCFTIDDRLSAIGSFNWDMRSAYLDTELMLVIDSRELNRELRAQMVRYEQEALKVADQETYDLTEGRVPREIGPGKQIKLTALRILIGWARFLM